MLHDVFTIGGAAILGLMVMVSIRERKPEISVLLALGEQKGKLIGQFIMEGFIVAVVAIGLPTGLVNYISEQLLESNSQ